MTHSPATLTEFNIVGLNVRTTNLNGQSSKDIGELWTRFMSLNGPSMIRHRLSDDVICMYTDYEGDFMQPYTAILGCKVKSLEDIPQGFISKTIPAAKYERFADRGQMPDVVMNIWKSIWNGAFNRAYGADFDVYGKNSKDWQNAEVETWLSIH